VLEWTGGGFALTATTLAHGQSGEFNSGVARFGGIGCTSTLNYPVDQSRILGQMWAEAASEWP